MALSRGKGSTGPACVAGFLCSHFVGILTSLAPDEWAGPKAWTDLPGGLEKAWKSVDCCGCSFGCWGGRSWSDLAGAGGCGSLSGGGGGGLGKAWEGLSPVSPRGDLALPSWYRLSFLCFLESPPPPRIFRVRSSWPQGQSCRVETPPGLEGTLPPQRLPATAVFVKARELKRMIRRGGRPRTRASRPPHAARGSAFSHL